MLKLGRYQPQKIQSSHLNVFHLLVRNYEIWAVVFTLLPIFSCYRTIPRYIYILIAIENARQSFTKRYGNILDHRIDVFVPFQSVTQVVRK